MAKADVIKWQAVIGLPTRLQDGDFGSATLGASIDYSFRRFREGQNFAAASAVVKAPRDGWDERSAKNLVGVHKDIIRVLEAARLDPFSPAFRVIEGLRTKERQRELLAAGKSTTMNSRHLTGHAVDVVPWVDLDNDGSVESNELFNAVQIRILANALKAAAADLGIPFEWGGDWKSFYDGPHYQLPWNKYPA